MNNTLTDLYGQYGVLYIDDEQNNLYSFKATFRHTFTLFTAISAKEGRKVLDANEIGVIITDQRMPITTGIQFLESIIQVYPDTIRILLTGFADASAVHHAIESGYIYKYMVKPWQEDELKTDIHSALELYHLRKENKVLTRKLTQANAELQKLRNM